MNQVLNYLNELFKDPKCELNYEKDYELLIAVMLSAQTTDRKVNLVTKELWKKYKNIMELKDANIEDLMEIIKPLGTFRRKAMYVKSIAESLYKNQNSTVPNDRNYIENLKGVGHKTANVVLSNLYNVPCIAVDTHVARVSKRLNLVKEKDDIKSIEKKLEKLIDKELWSKTHHQLVLFGRYKCTAIKPKCSECKLQELCKFYQNRGN